MIIDLDTDYSRKKEKIEVITTPGVPEVVTSVSPPEEKSKKTLPEQPPVDISNRRDFLMEQIDLEDRQVRAERAAVHRRYFTLLKPDLTPKASGSEFLEIYDEIESLTEALKNIHIRREQVERYGEEKRMAVLDDATLAKIDALKHKRRLVIDNLSKNRRILKMAESSGNQKKAKNASDRIHLLEMQQIEIQHELKNLENG